MKTVIVGDMHNRLEAVTSLFLRIGIIDENGNRNPGFHVIQMGDRLSLGYFEQEAEFYQRVDPWIDVQLLGNHEYPFVAQNPNDVMFGGAENRDYVAEQMLRRDYFLGKWQMVTSVGKWLITHAGLHPAWMTIGPLVHCNTASDYAETLEMMFEDFREVPANQTSEHPYWPVFNAIGQQRSSSNFGPKYGGIVWNDIADLKPAYEEQTGVPQICGHSSYCDTGLQTPDLWCLDTKGGCAALVTSDDGETFELFIEERTPKPRQYSVEDLSYEEVKNWIDELNAEERVAYMEDQLAGWPDE